MIAPVESSQASTYWSELHVLEVTLLIRADGAQEGAVRRPRLRCPLPTSAPDTIGELTSV